MAIKVEAAARCCQTPTWGLEAVSTISGMKIDDARNIQQKLRFFMEPSTTSLSAKMFGKMSIISIAIDLGDVLGGALRFDSSTKRKGRLYLDDRQLAG